MQIPPEGLKHFSDDADTCTPPPPPPPPPFRSFRCKSGALRVVGGGALASAGRCFPLLLLLLLLLLGAAIAGGSGGACKVFTSLLVLAAVVLALGGCESLATAAFALSAAGAAAICAAGTKCAPTEQHQVVHYRPHNHRQQKQEGTAAGAAVVGAAKLRLLRLCPGTCIAGRKEV